MNKTFTIKKELLDAEFFRVFEEYFKQNPEANDEDFVRDTEEHFVAFLKLYGTEETSQ